MYPSEKDNVQNVKKAEWKNQHDRRIHGTNYANSNHNIPRMDTTQNKKRNKTLQNNPRQNNQRTRRHRPKKSFKHNNQICRRHTKIRSAR